MMLRMFVLVLGLGLFVAGGGARPADALIGDVRTNGPADVGHDETESTDGPVEAGNGERDGEALIGYTELRTNLPGGRHANVATMRAMIVGVDGTGRRGVAEELAREADSWTQL